MIKDKAWQRLIRWLLRLIYPLYLREKISYNIQKLFPNLGERDVSFEFNRSLKFDLSRLDVGHIPIIYNGFYEREVTKSILHLGKEGGVMIDVGANYGYFSCIWATQNAKNKVHAFEASALNIDPLNNNIRKNGLTNQIKVIASALGKEKGAMSFCHERETNQTGWGGFTLDQDRKAVNVEVNTLDAYADENEIEEIEVLKIDTEGADTWVLDGARRLIEQRKIRHIFYEYNLPRMELLNIDPQKAMGFLKKNDYQVKEVSENEFYAFPTEDKSFNGD